MGKPTMFQQLQALLQDHLMHSKFRLVGMINGSEKRAVVIVQIYALFKKFEIDLNTGEVTEHDKLS